MTHISESPQDGDSESQGGASDDRLGDLADDDGTATQASDASQAPTTVTGTGPSRGANLGHKN